MAKYILKAFFLTTFPSNKKKCPKIYVVTMVLPLKASLTTLYTHRIIEFTKTLISNHFLGLWISKKNVKMYRYVKKSQLLKKKNYFSVRNARKYSKSKIDFKNVFLRVFRHLDSQFYIFFEKLRLFYIRHIIFRLRFARVHNNFSQWTEESVVKVLK